MVEEKALLSSSSSAGRSAADRESLIQEQDVEGPPKAGPPPPSAYHSGREVCLILTDNSWPSPALSIQRFFLFIYLFSELWNTVQQVELTSEEFWN
jgi:hypothetical protein